MSRPLLIVAVLLVVGLLAVLAFSFGLFSSPGDGPRLNTANGTRGGEQPGNAADERSASERLLDELSSADVARRVAICGELARLREPAVADALQRLVIADPVTEVRRAALQALITNRPDDLTSRLTPFLDHHDREIRQDTLRAFTNLADAAALEPLLERLRNRSYQPRWLVIDAIAAMRVDAVAPELARIAADSTQPKQDRIRALGHLASFAQSADARAAITRCADDADEDIARIARAIQ